MVRMLCPAKAVGGKDKSRARRFGGALVQGSIAYIDSVFQTEALGKNADIVCFGQARISRTEVPGKEGAKTGSFQKKFNIAALTVADNKKRKTPGKGLDCFLNSLVGSGRMASQNLFLRPVAFFQKLFLAGGRASLKQNLPDLL